MSAPTRTSSAGTGRPRLAEDEQGVARDTWRVCGRTVKDDRSGRGCVCPPHGPTAAVAVAARIRRERAA